MKGNAVPSGVFRCQSIKHEILCIKTKWGDLFVYFVLEAIDPEIYSQKNHSYFSHTFRSGYEDENRRAG